MQVMETSKKELGAGHSSTFTSMNNLAFTWKGQGKAAEATSLVRECVRLVRTLMQFSGSVALVAQLWKL
jgi:hypothetical protein